MLKNCTGTKIVFIFIVGEIGMITSEQEFQVLIGNRNLMQQHGLSIEKNVDDIMKKEETLGRMAILAAIDSKRWYIFKIYTFITEFGIKSE